MVNTKDFGSLDRGSSPLGATNLLLSRVILYLNHENNASILLKIYSILTFIINSILFYGIYKHIYTYFYMYYKYNFLIM